MTPPVVLVERLADARRAGEPFASAWPPAFAAALDAEPARWEKSEWATVLGGMVDVFRGAFERRPAPSIEAAFDRLADPDRSEPVPAHLCEHCGEEIPPDRIQRMGVRYCSYECQRAFQRERERVSVGELVTA